MELQMAQKYHGKFKVSRQFQFTHGNLNLLTAISIYLRQFQFYSRQFQFTHGNFNLLTAISIYLRQFQFYLRQFQFTHGNFNLLTAISIYLRPLTAILHITSSKVDFRARTRDP